MELEKVHEPCRVRVTYAQTGNDCRLITCGEDAQICTVSRETLKVLNSVKTKGDPLFSLAYNPRTQSVAVGDSAGFVKSYKLDGLEYKSVLTRTQLGVRALTFSKSGTILAVAGDASSIRLIDVNNENKVFLHLRPSQSARAMAYDPEGVFVAIVSSTGNLQIWDVAEGKNIKTKTSVARKVGQTSKVGLGMSWHPDGGTLLAVPGSDNDVVMFERLSWDETPQSALKGVHTAPVNVVSFSPNGLYAATGGEDKLVVIWDVQKASSIAQKTVEHAVTDLTWHPTENEIAAVTDSGEIGKWNKVIPQDLTGPAIPIDELNLENDEDAELADREIEALFDSDDNDDLATKHNDNSESNGIKNGNNPVASRGFFTSTFSSMMKPQDAIQPGSTPDLESEQAFFLCYNSYGFIALRHMDGYNTAQVVLSDPSNSTRIPLLTDDFGFTMGSLGPKGAVYCCPVSDEHPSTIVYRPYNSWAANSDWSVRLPQGEECKCIAAGASFVACLTDRQMLRVFSLGGMQRHILSLSGKPVALCAHKNLLGVIFHAFGSGMGGQQNLNYMIYDVSSKVKRDEGSVVLSANSILQWAGFSATGIFAAYDSCGILRMCSPEYSGAWVPVFEAEKEKKSEENFWMVGVREKSVQCVACTSQNPHPKVHPPSTVIELPLTIPGIPLLDTKLIELESDHMLGSMLLANEISKGEDTDPQRVENRKKSLDKCLLQLFFSATKANKHGRALDMVPHLHQLESVEGALKLANTQRSTALGERISAYLERRIELEAQEENDEDSLFDFDVGPRSKVNQSMPFRTNHTNENVADAERDDALHQEHENESDIGSSLLGKRPQDFSNDNDSNKNASRKRKGEMDRNLEGSVRKKTSVNPFALKG